MADSTPGLVLACRPWQAKEDEMYGTGVLRKSQPFLFLLALLPLILAVVAYRISSTHVSSVAATLSTVHDAETGQRGYLLTGRQDYLTPFLRAETRIETAARNIQVEAQRNGVPASEITNLQKAITAKMDELRLTVQLRQNNALAAALAEVETNRGQVLMSEIRSIIARLKEEQTAAFAHRLDGQRRSQRRLNLVLASGVVLGFILLFLSFRFNNEYVQERDQN